jgi:hypothetical protein
MYLYIYTHIFIYMYIVFAPWPLRFYILGDGLVQWIASPSDGTFPIEDLKVALQRCAHERL